MELQFPLIVTVRIEFKISYMEINFAFITFAAAKVMNCV